MPNFTRSIVNFDWQNVECREITEVIGHFDCHMRDGSERWWAIVIALDGRYIKISVNEDTDEILVDLFDISPIEEGWTHVGSLGELIGQKLGWCWEGRNYLGYLDTFTISTPNLVPQYTFLGMASTLKILRLNNVRSA